MKRWSFRTLTAEVPGELLDAQVGTISRHAETTTEAAISSADWIPAPEYPQIWAALAVLSNTTGVIDHATASRFLPARTEGEQP